MGSHHPKPVFLGIDFGTSGCRGCVIDAAQRVVAEAQCVLPPALQQHGRVEQESSNWIDGLTDLLRSLGQQVELATIQRLALNGTSGTVLLTDQRNQPLTPARMYNDASGQSQLDHIAAACSCNSHITLSAGSTLARVVQLVEDHQPEPLYRVAHQADFLAAWLGGRHAVSDYHNSLKLGFDPQDLSWPGWIGQLLPVESLPQVLTPGTPIGRVGAEVAGAFGFDPALEVCAGTTDANAAFIASRLNRPGDAMTSLGSTLVVKLLSDTRVDLPARGVYSHRLGDLWLVGGASNAGSAVLRDHFSDQQLAELSARIDIDHPIGLDYYPLKGQGERFPDPDPQRQPCLEPRPESDVEFLQAILESLSRIEQRAYSVLRDAGAPRLTRVETMGGGAANPAWTALREKLLGVPVTPAQHTEAAFGSALLALRGLHAGVD